MTRILREAVLKTGTGIAKAVSPGIGDERVVRHTQFEILPDAEL